MSVQARLNNSTIPLILSDDSLVRNGTITQDESRTTDLLKNTVVAYNPTTGQWVPFNDLTQTNGESVPRGIYLGDDIEAADLAAADYADAPILVGNATVNYAVVVWDDDTLDAASIVNPGNIEARSARYALIAAAGIFLEDTVEISEDEN